MRAVVVPAVPALLPAYAGRVDPVAELRAACLEAVAWLGDGPATVWCDQPSDLDLARGVTEPLGLRVARALGVEPAQSEGEGHDRVLVVANGSACRSEKAPGHLDERAFAFDDAIEAALAAGDAATLRGLDEILGADLLASGVPGLRRLGEHEPTSVHLDLAQDPYGVRYWVARWES